MVNECHSVYRGRTFQTEDFSCPLECCSPKWTPFQCNLNASSNQQVDCPSIVSKHRLTFDLNLHSTNWFRPNPDQLLDQLRPSSSRRLHFRLSGRHSGYCWQYFRRFPRSDKKVRRKGFLYVFLPASLESFPPVNFGPSSLAVLVSSEKTFVRQIPSTLDHESQKSHSNGFPIFFHRSSHRQSHRLSQRKSQSGDHLERKAKEWQRLCGQLVAKKVSHPARLFDKTNSRPTFVSIQNFVVIRIAGPIKSQYAKVSILPFD